MRKIKQMWFDCGTTAWLKWTWAFMFATVQFKPSAWEYCDFDKVFSLVDHHRSEYAYAIRSIHLNYTALIPDSSHFRLNRLRLQLVQMCWAAYPNIILIHIEFISLNISYIFVPHNCVLWMLDICALMFILTLIAVVYNKWRPHRVNLFL